MKRVNNIYKELYNIDNIYNMCNKVCRNVKNKNKVNNFETYKSEHIINIKNRLINKDNNMGKYNIFMISDPKCRIVMSQNIEDKVINHLVADYILVNTFENKYLDFMCATRIGKGTLYGIKLLKKYLNEMKNKYNNFYVLKIDIKKYFYSIDHNVLKSILRRKIKDKNALYILDNIIDSTNSSYVNNKIINIKNSRLNWIINNNSISKLEKMRLINEINKIPLYKFNKGVPIGDQTSQAFGLIYLYELNHYIKEKLHIKYLINYMDDYILIHQDKQYLKHCLSCIKYYLNNNLKLEINDNKTKIDNIKNGIDFLEYRFYINNNKVILKLRNNTKKKFKKRVKDINLLIINKLITNKEYNIFLSSYKGILMYGSCNNLYNRSINEII